MGKWRMTRRVVITGSFVTLGHGVAEQWEGLVAAAPVRADHAFDPVQSP